MSDHESIRAAGELRDELLRAASDHRSMADAWSSPASGPAIRKRRPPSGWLGVAIGTAVAIVVAVVALVLPGRGGHVRHSAAPPSCTQQLLGELGVLRRPQTTTDRAFRPPPVPTSGTGQQAPGRFPYVSVLGLTRLARTLPNGSRVYLATYAPTPGSLAAPLGDLVFVFVAGPRTGTPTLVGEVSAPLLESSAQLPPTKSGDVLLSVVPDQVTRVRWTFPREQLPDRPALLHAQAGRVFPAATLTATVVGNVAAATVDPRAYFMPSGTTWFNAAGQPVKTVHFQVPNLAKTLLKSATTASQTATPLASPVRCAGR